LKSTNETHDTIFAVSEMKRENKTHLNSFFEKAVRKRKEWLWLETLYSET